MFIQRLRGNLKSTDYNNFRFFPNIPLPHIMRTKIPSAALFTAHRKNLGELLPPSSMAIVQSNDMQVTNADAFQPFKQSNDLFYLTGVAQEETVLILFPNAREPEDREILFLRESNDHIAIWEGAKLTKAQATERTGIARIEWTSEFNGILSRLMMQAENIYLSTNEHPRGDLAFETKSLRFAKECQALYPLHKYNRLAPLIYGLRSIKSEEEIEFTQIACDITEAGFRRVLGFVEPGIGEWEVEAEFIHEFIRRGSHGFAYGPIIAGGVNACILHYIPNDQVLKEGELLLMDVAAEYGGWNSDMTRTIPVSGKFTPRQRDVYNAVLRMVRYADSILRPGVFIADFQKMVIAQMDKELIGLGLYTAEEAAAAPKDKPLVKKYYMHGTSHHLGLDVHDVSPANQAVAPGMIFTIEPGIYIPEEGMGVRLENDYLIGENGNIDLMANIPIEADEIEALMAR
jgi:Xaa-Pro aminopeptidase